MAGIRLRLGLLFFWIAHRLQDSCALHQVMHLSFGFGFKWPPINSLCHKYPSVLGSLHRAVRLAYDGMISDSSHSFCFLSHTHLLFKHLLKCPFRRLVLGLETRRLTVDWRPKWKEKNAFLNFYLASLVWTIPVISYCFENSKVTVKPFQTASGHSPWGNRISVFVM